MNSWVIVPCPATRAHELDRLLESLQHPARRVLAVTTSQDTLPGRHRGVGRRIVVDWDGPRISAWWNAGLDAVAERADGPWEALVVSSDVTGDATSVGWLAAVLRDGGLSMVGPDWHGLTDGRSALRLESGARRDVFHRVPGACWMVAGEQGLRCDTRFRWWYSDDDLEMQARHRYGAALVPATGLLSAAPDTGLATDELQRWAVEDRALYVEKWGVEPW